MNECLIPTSRSSEDNRWISQHNRHVHECKEAEPEVLLIGDSIIQKMPYYEKFWSSVSGFHPINLGIGGDRVQHLLWRIINGSLNEIYPRAIVLHIGTNCADSNPEEIVEGIEKVMEELRRIYPSTYIIIWGLLPRGEYPNKLSTRNEQVNEILKKKFENKPLVDVICSGDVLRQTSGQIDKKDMYDFLHLTEQGYIKSFTPVLEKLKDVLNISY